MSTSFRPVIEKWGSPSSCFIKPRHIESVLTALSLAAFPAGKVSSTEYDELNVVWIEEGGKFLDYIDSKSVDQLLEDSGEVEDINDVEDMRGLLSSIKHLSSEWRQQIDESDGSLRFYVDQY